MDDRVRCPWPGADAAMVAYHDTEWGVPVYDDRALFAKLLLDGFQAGLSWAIILRKRDGIHAAFEHFDPQVLARFDAARVEALLADPRIIRNRRKVEAAVTNARAYLAIQERGSFSALCWDAVGGSPIVNRWGDDDPIPAETPQSRTLSKALKAAGLKFVGPTICYAFMQAVGMVNDHLVTCYRHAEVARAG